jgi:hypothetical protein
MTVRLVCAGILSTWIVLHGQIGNGHALAGQPQPATVSVQQVADGPGPSEAQANGHEAKTESAKSSEIQDCPGKGDKEIASSAKAQEGKDEDKSEVPEPIQSQHTLEIAGQQIAYTATAGKIAMKTDEGEE